MQAVRRKVTVGGISLLISLVSSGAMVLAVGVVYIALLRYAMGQGPGSGQAAQVLVGGLLVLLLPMGWLALTIWTFDHLDKGARKGTLARRAAMLGAIVLYLFPLLVVIYELAFPDAMTGLAMVLPVAEVRADLWLAGLGAALGTALLLAGLAMRRD